MRRSHHCGVLGHYAESIARNNLIGLAFSNTPSAMAPWGGNKPSFGTNPLAFGCPCAHCPDGQPIVVDMSLSKVARGKIMNAVQKGESSIPEGWALDAGGMPTTDPVQALRGTMVPMGDAKGAALVLMVEILSATLTGSNHAFEASSFFEAEGPAPGIGQSFILISPTRVNPDFPHTLERLTPAYLRTTRSAPARSAALCPAGKRQGRRAGTARCPVGKNRGQCAAGKRMMPFRRLSFSSLRVRCICSRSSFSPRSSASPSG